MKRIGEEQVVSLSWPDISTLPALPALPIIEEVSEARASPPAEQEEAWEKEKGGIPFTFSPAVLAADARFSSQEGDVWGATSEGNASGDSLDITGETR